MSKIRLYEQSNPSTPPANSAEIFLGTDNVPYVIQEDGTITSMLGGGGGGGTDFTGISVKPQGGNDDNHSVRIWTTGSSSRIILRPQSSAFTGESGVIEFIDTDGTTTRNYLYGSTSFLSGATFKPLAVRNGLWVNAAQAAADSRFSGTTLLDLLYLSASANRVGIGTASALRLFQVQGNGGSAPLMRLHTTGSSANEYLLEVGSTAGGTQYGFVLALDEAAGNLVIRGLVGAGTPGTELLRLGRGDGGNYQIGVFGGFGSASAAVNINSGGNLVRLDNYGGAVFNTQQHGTTLATGPDYGLTVRGTAAEFGVTSSELFMADPYLGSITVYGTKPEHARINVQAKGNDQDHACILLAGCANQLPASTLYMFVGTASDPIGAGAYGWRFELDELVDGSIFLNSLNGDNVKVLCYRAERNTGNWRFAKKVKIGADSTPGRTLDVEGDAVFSQFVDVLGISVPANPSAGTRRIFVDGGGTGELSVKTQAGATVSLESVANDAITNAKLANMAANSVKVRNAGTSGDPSDAASADLTTGSPASGDFLLGWESTGELRKFDVGALPTGGGGEANTSSNQGAGGVGIVLAKSGIDLPFKSINVVSTSRLTVTDDGPNKEVDLDIPTDAIDDTRLRNSAATSVIGRSGGTSGDPADIAASADDQVLRRASGALGFGTVATGGIADAAVTYAKIQDVTATDKVLGRATAGAGDVEEIACTAAGRALIDDTDAAAQRTTLGLGALATKSSVATGDIDADAVTYAKIQNVSATDKVLGRATAGAGDVEEIACTSAGRALIDDATASDQRTTLGLGALATKSSIATGDIDADAVTYAKIQNLATDRLLGRDTAGTGDAEELTVGGGLEFSGAGGIQIANDGVTYAKIQNVTSGKVLGRVTAGSGDTEELSPAHSVILDGTGLRLSGDSSAPGNNQVYGTDGSGVKGWKADPAGGGGDSVSVNGTSATDADFDDATPAASAGMTNVKWQKDTSTPNNISAQLDWGLIMDGLRRKPFVFTDCLSQQGNQLTAPWLQSAISSGTQSQLAGEASHPGIFRWVSAAAANSGYMLFMNSASIIIAGGECFECVFRIQTLTNTTIRLGFGDSASATEHTDGAWIEVPSTGAAVLKTKNNAGPTTSSTIATLSTGTWYRCRVEVNSGATSVAGTIWTDDGTQQGTQSNTGNIPTAAGRETGVAAMAISQSTVNIVDIDFVSFWYDTRALTR
jgi:uncharacterized protein with putative carbohydrate binding module/uncharacterized protein DUF5907